MQCLRLPGAVTSHNVPVCSSLRTASGARLVQAARPALAVARAARPACSASQQPPKQRQQQQQLAAQRPASGGGAAPSAAMLAALWTLAAQLPASAAELELSGGPPASSYYVSLGLFLMSVPGLWSLIKRSPKAKIKRKTFEVAGPAEAGAMPLDQRARQIFAYFAKYNYEVQERGEVITFVGNYKASISQALSLMMYTLVGLGSTALVLSITFPQVGNWWYAMCLTSPAAAAYYWKNAERTETFKVKMVTSDDERSTDIVVEGDDEEIERFWKELGLNEKGKVLVKGLLG